MFVCHLHLRIKLLRVVSFVLLAVSLSAALAEAEVQAQGLVGQQPVPVRVIEHHAEALCLWHELGARPRVLVHVDAHDDIYSSLVRIDHGAKGLAQALAGTECGQLAPRLQTAVRDDSLAGIGDFIRHAWRLGLVREVWWVVPNAGMLAPRGLQAYRDELHGRYPERFIASLGHQGGWISGNLAGVPLRILPLANLPAFDEPVLLDIDTDWFPSARGPWQEESTLNLVGRFFRTLRDKSLTTDLVTISASTEGGFTPLLDGYLPEMLAELLGKPGSFAATGPPESWLLRDRTAYLLRQGNLGQALVLNRTLAQSAGQEAQAAYNLAYVELLRGNLGAGVAALDRAGKRLPRYLFGYVALAKRLADSGRLELAQSLLVEGGRHHPEQPAIWQAAGDLALAAEDYPRAHTAFARLREVAPRQPAGYAGGARAAWLGGAKTEAEGLMEKYLGMAWPGEDRDRAVTEWNSLTAAKH